MSIAQEITNLIENALASLGLSEVNFVVEHPTDLKMGDYSTNVGIKTGQAKAIVQHLEANLPAWLERIEVAGPGFINFYLSKEFFKKSLNEINNQKEVFGKNQMLEGQTVAIEYTDPNVMKPFHIGHLMSNTLGEAISRIIEWSGAKIIRLNYYSDSGLNIAKAVWGVKEKFSDLPSESDNLSQKAGFLGGAYALGVTRSAEDELVAKEIEAINKKIYERSDEEINKLYDLGKRWSLEYLDRLYERLGTTFDKSIAESEVARDGQKIVQEFMKKGVFEESEGAIVFRGEKYNPKLHTRVFINKLGLPTYEAKELGVAFKKFDLYNPDVSIIITANEQNDYFKVVLEAIKQINGQLALKTKHLSHGVLKLPSGKMSSRTGNVITAEGLIEEVKEKVRGEEEVAVGAIKYMILRQVPGHDIIFDFEKSVSTEGDSGVYLQYAHARANSILSKGGEGETSGQRSQTHEIERLLYRFPEIVEHASREYAPNYLTTYLTELASSFNNFYAHEPVLEESPESAYRLAIVQAFQIVMRNGLNILGIPAPERV